MNRHSVYSIVCLVLGRFSVLVCSVPALLSVTSLQSHWKWEDCILSGMLRIGPCCVLVEVCFGALECLVLCSPVLWGTEQGTSPPPCVGKWTPGLGCTLCLSPFTFVILRHVLNCSDCPWTCFVYGADIELAILPLPSITWISTQFEMPGLILFSKSKLSSHCLAFVFCLFVFYIFRQWFELWFTRRFLHSACTESGVSHSIQVTKGGLSW